MKVVIPTDTYYPHVNGASYFTQRLAASLASRGHEVVVVAPSQTWRHQERVEESGVRVIELPSFPVMPRVKFRGVIPFRLRSAARQIIKDFQPDIIHVQGHFWIARAVVAVGYEMGIPLVGTNHFMPENLLHYIPLPVFMKRWIWKGIWWDFNRVFSRFDIITTPTKTAADLLHKTGFTREVLALSCGINRAIFHPGYDTSFLEDRYHVPTSKPLLLYVGRLDHEKNVDFVLRALALVRVDKRPHFLIGGRGAEGERLNRLAKYLGLEKDVTFLGFVPNEDLPALYCLADCFVIAGTAELQSIVTMEAMASGLPVLGVNAVALPELVHDGVNGYLFSLEKPELLAKKITEVMNDEAKRSMMGQQSLSLIGKHDSEAVLQRYETVYRGLLEN